MKILWITFGLPYPPQAGSPMRDYFLMREISKSAAIDLVCIYPPGTATDTGTLPSFCHSVELIAIPDWPLLQTALRSLAALCTGRPLATVPFFFPEAARRIADLLQRTPYDLVQVESAQLLAYGLLAAGRCPAILSLHNVGYQHYASMAQISRSSAARVVLFLKAALLKNAERHFAPAYSQAVLVSLKEKVFFQAIAPHVPAAAVDNGVDCQTLQLLPPSTAPELLFVGIMNYPPMSTPCSTLPPTSSP